MIKEYRKSRKLTQAQLGEMAGVVRSTVAWCERYENIKTGRKLIAEYPTWQEAVNSKEFNQ